MTPYRVTLASAARRELTALDSAVVERILPRIRSLAQNPRPAGSKKLEGANRYWRIRIGDYRVVYAIDDSARTVDITRVAHRREAYRQ